MPRVTVVMPAYNASATIGGAIASAVGQTYRDLELVVVDDGSSDATGAIAQAHGDRVRMVRQENRGVAAARNRGVAEASGELIAFCDADDFLFDRHLEELVAVYDAAPSPTVATANAYWLMPGGIRKGHLRHKAFPPPERQRMAILEQNFVSVMSLFPRTLAAEIGPFDDELRRAEDWDFWMRAVFAGYRVAHQPKPLALYRWGATGLSAGPESMDAAARAVLERAAKTLDLSTEERAFVERALAGPGARTLSREGDRALAEGRYRDAARLWGEAAAVCPSETPLVRKARLMRTAAPVVGPLLRLRQRREDEALGVDERFQR